MSDEGWYMKRHWQYLKYVLRHKWFVFWAGLFQGVPILWLVIHDWDKFLPSMWFAYAKTFYKVDGTPQYEPDESFDRAWNAHQKRNKHHWQYWMLTMDSGETVLLEMPKSHLKEMIADWRGAGRALGNPDTEKWYLVNRHKMQLHQATRLLLEELLDVDFTAEELERADFQSTVENWPVESVEEAALHIRRSRRLARAALC